MSVNLQKFIQANGLSMRSAAEAAGCDKSVIVKVCNQTYYEWQRKEAEIIALLQEKGHTKMPSDQLTISTDVLVKTSNPSSGEFQDRKLADADNRPLYEIVGEYVAKWGEEHMGDTYSYVGAVVGATYPEMGKVLRKIMPKTYILVPGYGAQGGKGADLVHFFNEDGLGAIVNSSRGIIAAYQQEKYASFGSEHFAEASRAAVEDMRKDIMDALNNRS